MKRLAVTCLGGVLAAGLVVAAPRAQDGTACEVAGARDPNTKQLTGGLKCSKPNAAAQQSAAQASGQSGAAGTQPATPAAAPQSTAKKFPYPGEAPSAADQPDAPAVAPAGTAAPQSTAKRFPYPGETPSAADQPDAPPVGAGAGAQRKTPQAYPGDPDAAKAAGEAADGFSSSSSSSSDDSAGPMTDEGSSGEETPVPSRRKKLKKIDPQTPKDREAEDLDVADFYMKLGNYVAAYGRSKDAVNVKPDDPFAQFALAEAARKLGKQDEAREHYGLCLKLDPGPKEQKASERALAELTAKR
jgi:hypothetical protein